MQLGLQIGDQQKPGAGPFWLVVASWLGWKVVGCKSFRAGVGCEVWSNEPAPIGGLGKGAIRG